MTRAPFGALGSPVNLSFSVNSQFNYFRISNAKSLRDVQERRLYRFFEMLPGILSWGSLFLAVIGSRLFPAWISVFVITFVLYWFFRTIYFFFHLRSSYRKMRISEQTDWISKLDALRPEDYSVPVSSWKDLYHCVVLPAYQEPVELIRESIYALRGALYPKERMVVVLAMEERIGKRAREIGEAMQKEFSGAFSHFLVTYHPADLPGEIAGKGSNETWAAKEVKSNIIDLLNIPYERVLFSAFDIDTVVFPKYFACLSYQYLTTEKPTRTSYQPIPLFLNNMWEAPGISRVFSFSSTFWHLMNQERPEKLITFSSHSMSFKTLVDIGFKQTDVVSDDSRVFWQCFFAYDGDYRTQPMYYPISMDANAAPTLWKTILHIYKQKRRWAYGAGEIPFVVFNLVKKKTIPFARYGTLLIELLEGHWSWASASLLIFVLGWLPLLIGGEQFSSTLISYNLPRVTSRILTASMIGLLWSIYLSMLLLPPRPKHIHKFSLLVFLLQWVLLPFSMLLSSLPALDAQTRLLFGRYMGFWATPKFRRSPKT